MQGNTVSIYDRHSASILMLKYHIWAVVVTGVLSLLARNPVPVAGAFISGLLMVPFIYLLEETSGPDD